MVELRWQRWILACAMAVAGPVAAAPSWAELAYQPVALGWSAREVDDASAGSTRALVERARAQGLEGCRRYCAQLQRVFARLVPLARLQTERARHLPWTLTVLRSADVDAMALPGGRLLISEVFLREQHLDDAMLAFVLAHEMSHSILEHERQTLQYARQLLPRNVRRSVADMYVEIDYNYTLLKSLEPVMQAGEFEADELGLLLASAAGYAPARQLRFIEAAAARPEGAAPLVRTHPAARERLARLRERLPLALRIFAAARAAKTASATSAHRAARS